MATDLLGELLLSHVVEKTNRKDKLEIDGVVGEYPIYRIPLDKLFYNDRNDRIATAICKYKDEHGEDSINLNNFEEYNSILQTLIEESNPSKLEDTQQSIKDKGQLRFGIVLNDGRIIDGNRRFTCLRRLYNDRHNAAYGFFDAVILNKNYENNEKSIKRLELSIQIGEEEKDKYDPIDRLVGIYRDIEETKQFTIDEYVDYTRMKATEVKKALQKARLMVEMLEAIGAPKKYYLIKDLKLDGTLSEMPTVLNKLKGDEKQTKQLKLTLFADMVAAPRKELNRYVRDIGKLDASHIVDLVQSQKTSTLDVIDSLKEKETVSLNDIYTIRRDENLKKHLEDTLAIAKERNGRAKKRNSPKESMQNAYDDLNGIDSKVLPLLTSSEINTLLKLADDIGYVLEDIKKELTIVSRS